MKKYKVIVSSMTATYDGFRYGNSENEVIADLRAEYRRLKDNRANWDMRAREVKEEEED